MVDAAAFNVAEAQIKALQNIILIQDKQMRAIDNGSEAEA